MNTKLSTFFRWASAAILFQTLFFKFSGAPESVYIFSQLGVEPWGRWASGCAELIAAVLLIIPATQAIGALMATGIITGALLSHVFVLGIVVQDDGGLLFILALTVFVFSGIVVYWNRHNLLGTVANLLRGSKIN